MNVRRSILVSFYLGVILLALDVIMWFTDRTSALLLLCFVVFYFVVIAFLAVGESRHITNDLVSFATAYGQIQRTILRDLDVPYALLDTAGRVVWTDAAFDALTGNPHGTYRKSVTNLFPGVTVSKFPRLEDGEKDAELHISQNEKDFLVRLRALPIGNLHGETDIIESSGLGDTLIAMFLYDETAINLALNELDAQSVCVGLLYLDNYDEALESVEEVRRALLMALTDRKINKYFSSSDAICRSIEKDKYLIVMRKETVIELESQRFGILDDVKTVNIGNETAITISIGIGMNGLSYSQNYEFARRAIEVALGRGGDQAVVRTPDGTSYYGGKTQQIERNTRVKARVKAHALTEIITSRDKVFVMGHKMPDVDSFGAAVGVCAIARSLGKEAYIVVSELTQAVRGMVESYTENEYYEGDKIITGQKAIDMVTVNSAVVVVDVNKPSRTDCPELLHKSACIVVLDHHRQGTEVIEDATLSYVEPYASSACEMITEVLQYVDGVKINSREADCLYSGIVLDTDNFTSKTGVRTFEAAAYLKRCGADMIRVRKMFRDDPEEYRVKADTVAQAEIYRKYYAISVCSGESILDPTIIAAQAANELLDIKGVRASFILTRYSGKVYVSARSIDETNVQVIMEKVGGGGHINAAGAQFENISVEEAEGLIRRTIDEMIDSGELSQ